MAPPKPPKKALKSMEKPVVKPIVKKIKKKNYQSFSIYIFKLLRSLSELNLGISRKTMLIMNDFVNQFLEILAVEAATLVRDGKNSTLGRREIESAVKLVIPGELAKHANIEGKKAILMFDNDKKKRK
ncbi:putative histone cluster 3, H2bb [Operophtera brumata]|uniref:Putative histone cluster 3, H2bb n=1 Tax=Operophtera brumata TaxID=104452 RepID=A0A0L7LBG9_OPEBR|nr:putative histone cluster 3, H2bb [Operophtera brumata]